MPDVWQLVLAAAVGGSIRGFLDFYHHVLAWRAGCREHCKRTGGSEGRPSFRRYCDVVPELVAATFHVGLGALAGGMFAGADQIDSVLFALGVGTSAPLLLQQLGTIKYVQQTLVGPSTTQSSTTSSNEAADNSHSRSIQAMTAPQMATASPDLEGHFDPYSASREEDSRDH